jgi:hypothetical protein
MRRTNWKNEMRKFSLKHVVAAAAFVAASGAANALVVFDFNTLQSPDRGTALPYSAGTLMFTDITGGVSVNLTSSTGWLGDTSFISKLYVAGLDYTSYGDYVGPDITGGNKGFSLDGGTNARFSYDWSLKLPTSNRDRLATNGVVTFNLFGEALDSMDFTGAMIHVQSLSGEQTEIFGQDSIKIRDGVPPIPEPETYALMLAGLGVVGFMARRRKAN